jgi:glycosyltransferase involved in cell wall biosynthesis
VDVYEVVLALLVHQRGEYDLVHVHSYLSTFPGKLMSGLFDIPVVFTIRGVSIDTKEGLSSTGGGIASRVRKRIERFVSVEMNYDAMISVNKQFVEQYGHAHRRIRYVPNGVDTGRFEADPPTDATDFLFVGRLVGQKRVSDLLRSFAEVRRSKEAATLTIVGEGPLESELRREARELGLGGSIEFAGRVPYEEMPAVYRSTDVFVLPSVWEGHPRVMLEAWSSSRPVIGTAVSGIEEFIADGENGWLVPVRDESALAERMAWCMEHPEAVEEAGRRAREEVIEEFSWQAIAEKTLDLYEDLL